LDVIEIGYVNSKVIAEANTDPVTDYQVGSRSVTQFNLATIKRRRFLTKQIMFSVLHVLMRQTLAVTCTSPRTITNDMNARGEIEIIIY